MQEHEDPMGSVDSSWVVGSDGITFHEHEGRERDIAEGQEGHAALRKLFEGRSLPELIEKLAEGFNEHPF